MLSVLRRWWRPQGEFSEAGQYGGGFTRCAGGAGTCGQRRDDRPFWCDRSRWRKRRLDDHLTDLNGRSINISFRDTCLNR